MISSTKSPRVPSPGVVLLSQTYDPYSGESRKRRARRIAQINAGWSIESERAMEAIADIFATERG